MTSTPMTTVPRSPIAIYPSTCEAPSFARSTNWSARVTRVRDGLDSNVARHDPGTPLGVESEDRLDVPEAQRILNADHDGLEDVKDRILEHLAVRKLQAERGLAPVDGRGSARFSRSSARRASARPPSVSRSRTRLSESTCASRSVAFATRRDRGHRRTYVGAQPGRLVRALREAGT